jgi:hypothetical protein
MFHLILLSKRFLKPLGEFATEAIGFPILGLWELEREFFDDASDEAPAFEFPWVS